MKKVLSIIMTVVVLLGLSACETAKKTLHTDIVFDKENVFLLSDRLIVDIHSDYFEVFKCDPIGESTTSLKRVEGSYKLSDSNGKTAIFEGNNSIIFYDVESGEITEVFDNVISPEEAKNSLRFHSFWADKGNESLLVVTKISYDYDAPITLGESLQIGYQVSDETGVSVYSFSDNKLKLKKTLTLNDLGIKLNEMDDVSFTAKHIGGGEVALVVKTNQKLAPVYNNYYVKLSAVSKNVTKIGESLKIADSSLIQSSWNENNFIMVDTENVMFVDFVNEMVINEQLTAVSSSSIDIFESVENNYFVLRSHSSLMTVNLKYFIAKGELDFERIEDEDLTKETFVKNAVVGGNTLVLLSNDEYLEHNDVLSGRVFYRSYSENTFLYDNDGKVSVFFKKI